MQILLIAATDQELKPIIASNAEIDVLVTGVGVPSTLYHLQKRIQQIDYNLIIQAGIAGAFKDTIQLGSVVLVKQDCFADIGMEENESFIPVHESALADKNELPFENGWLKNKNQFFETFFLPAVNAVTVNKVSDSLLQRKQLVKLFNADIETMEGAALHYVCLQENIPFIQIRAISNVVGERNKSKWKINEAINNLNKELSRLINVITQ